MPAHTLVRTEWIGPSATPSLGWAAWIAGGTYALNTYVFPTAPNVNGYYYKATSVTTGIAGATEPVWPTGAGSTVVDGGITWTRQYTTAILAAELAQLDASIAGLVCGGGAGGPKWTFNTVHAVDDFVVPTVGNGFAYMCTAVAFDHKSSPITEPTWPTTIGATVIDYHVTWTCVGPSDAGGGGSWAPQGPIIIGGQGLGLDVGIGLVLCRGGSLTLTNSGGIAFGAGDYPNYKPARSRVVQYSCALGRGWPDFCWRARFGDLGMQAVCGLIDLSDGNGPQPVTFSVPLRGHNGATVSQIKVYWRIGFPHQSLPSVLPSFRVVRVDSGGNVTPLTSTASGADANGWVSATSPASVAAWTGNQSITIPCDQNNVMDLTSYSYEVEIQEEQTPGGYPWSLVAKSPVVAVLNLASLPMPVGPQTVDGQGVSAGDRVLVMVNGSASLYGFLAGFWQVTSGAWVRTDDLAAPSDFSQGFLVPVDFGADFGGAYLQCVSTQTSWGGSGDLVSGGASGGGSVGAQVWSAGLGYANNTFIPFVVLPTHPNGLWYMTTKPYGDGDKVLLGGPTEPIWPVVVGQTVVDATAWSPGAHVPDYATTTPASTQYVPTAANYNGSMFVNFGGAGTTGATEPNWASAPSPGNTVMDNGITWTNDGPPLQLTCMGPTGDSLSFVPKPQLIDDGPGAPAGWYAHGSIFDSVEATYSNIQNGAPA